MSTRNHTTNSPKQQSFNDVLRSQVGNRDFPRRRRPEEEEKKEKETQVLRGTHLHPQV